VAVIVFELAIVLYKLGTIYSGLCLALNIDCVPFCIGYYRLNLFFITAICLDFWELAHLSTVLHFDVLFLLVLKIIVISANYFYYYCWC